MSRFQTVSRASLPVPTLPSNSAVAAQARRWEEERPKFKPASGTGKFCMGGFALDVASGRCKPVGNTTTYLDGFQYLNENREKKVHRDDPTRLVHKFEYTHDPIEKEAGRDFANFYLETSLPVPITEELGFFQQGINYATGKDSTRYRMVPNIAARCYHIRDGVATDIGGDKYCKPDAEYENACWYNELNVDAHGITDGIEKRGYFHNGVCRSFDYMKKLPFGTGFDSTDYNKAIESQKFAPKHNAHNLRKFPKAPGL